MSNRLLVITEDSWQEKARKANYHARELAKLCGVSMRTLERHFTKLMGKCPQCWLDKQRMVVARELLLDGSSVKETANRLGFKAQQHFSRMFKAHHGHTPTETVINYSPSKRREISHDHQQPTFIHQPTCRP